MKNCEICHCPVPSTALMLLSGRFDNENFIANEQIGFICPECLEVAESTKNYENVEKGITDDDYPIIFKLA